MPTETDSMLARLEEIEDEADDIKKMVNGDLLPWWDAKKELIELWREHNRLTRKLRELGVL